MTIASEIQRIKTNIENAYDALETAGATMPATENSANLASTIATISGGGDAITATNNSSSAVTNGDKVWIEPPVPTRDFTAFNNPTIDDATTTMYGKNDVNTGIYKNKENIQATTKREFIVKYKFATNSLSNLGAGYPTAHFSGSIDYGGNVYGFTRLFLSTNGWYLDQYASSDSVSVLPSTDVTQNVWYWFKLELTNTSMTSYYSMDGTTWTQVATKSVSGKLNLYADSSHQYTTIYCNRSELTCDLGGCAYLVDGQEFWKPYIESSTYSIKDFSSVTSSFLTGVASENIAISSTGSVKTILPEE